MADVRLSAWNKPPRVPTHLFQQAVHDQGHGDEFLWNRTQQIIVVPQVCLGGDDGSHCERDQTSWLQTQSPFLHQSSPTSLNCDRAVTNAGPEGAVSGAPRGGQSLFPKARPLALRPASHVPDAGPCGSSFCAFFFPAPRTADCGV